MQLDGIGQLTNQGTYWRLIYDRCGHVQEFARLAVETGRGALGVLDDPHLASADVHRRYAHCLTCKLAREQDARGQVAGDGTSSTS